MPSCELAPCGLSEARTSLPAVPQPVMHLPARFMDVTAFQPGGWGRRRPTVWPARDSIHSMFAQSYSPPTHRGFSGPLEEDVLYYSSGDNGTLRRARRCALIFSRWISARPLPAYVLGNKNHGNAADYRLVFHHEVFADGGGRHAPAFQPAVVALQRETAGAGLGVG